LAKGTEILRALLRWGWRDETPEQGSRRRRQVARLSILIPLFSYIYIALGMRRAILAEYRIDPTLADLRGVASDLWMVALMFTVLCLFNGWGRKVAALLLWFVIYIMSFGNYEYIKVLQSNAGLVYVLTYLKDPTFIAGSVFIITDVPLFVTGIVVSLTPLLIWLFLPGRRIPPLKVAAVTVALTVALVVWPTDDDFQKWRQYNCLHQNMLAAPQRDLLRKFQKPEEIPPKLMAQVAVRTDLSGEPRMKFGPGQNVLLIMMESVSGSFWDSMGAKQDAYRQGSMPRLDQRVSKGLLYRNFIANQRQTRRGIFSFLCGEYPNVSSRDAKTMYHVLAGGKGPTCLARTLAQEGYKTVFIQADTLAFNAKGQFLKQAGFSEYYGFDWFDHAYHWTGWGPDDLAFLEGVMKKLDALAKQPKPWFVGGINIGTHHPYQVPKTFKSDHPEDSFARSVDYLDHSMAWFLDTARKRGYLDNTMVIITSDESRGINPGLRGLTVSLSNNWIPMAVLTPGGEPGVVDDLYSQKDLAVSVLDYLGLGHKARGIRGRSMFRSYKERETIFMANTYSRWLGAFFPDNTLLRCNHDMYSCAEYQYPGTDFLRNESYLKKEAVTPEKLDLINAFITVNDKSYADIKAGVFKLLERDEVMIHVQPYPQLIFGEQYLVMEKNTAVRVDMELTVEEGEVTLEHYFTGHSTEHLRQFTTEKLQLKAGQSLSISYKIGVGSTLPKVQVKLVAHKESGPSARLRFTKATMQQLEEPHGRTKTLWSKVNVK